MNRRLLLPLCAAAALSLVLLGAGSSANNSTGLTVAQLTQFAVEDTNLVTLMDPPLDPSVDPPGDFHGVSPHRFDPGDTDTVQAKWLDGTGCLNAAATNNTSNPNGSYSDSVCTTGDPKDEENDGLLLEKGGPQAQNSAAFAELHNVKGITLTDIGYDIRSLDPVASISGSHCGAGAPRFNVYDTAGILYFIGCRSPLATSYVSGSPGTGDAWTRARWGTGTAGTVLGFCFASSPSVACPSNGMLVPITGTIQRIFVVFDEGTDIGPDYFGAAFLDNIDVNGQLVGKG
jgi:hypothetical protein